MTRSSSSRPPSAHAPLPPSSSTAYSSSIAGAISISEVHRLHLQNLKAMKKENEKLRGQIEELTALAKDHNKVKYIHKLKRDVDEKQTLINVLTQLLLDRRAISPQELTDHLQHVIDHEALDQPNPGRQKKELLETRRENTRLVHEVSRLKKALKFLVGAAQMKNYQLNEQDIQHTRTILTDKRTSTTSTGAYEEKDNHYGEEDDPLFPQPPSSARSTTGSSNYSTNAHLKEVEDLEYEISELKSSLSARDYLLEKQKALITSLNTEIRQLKVFLKNWEVSEEKRLQVEKELKEVKASRIKTVQEDELIYQELRLVKQQLIILAESKDALEVSSFHTRNELNEQIIKLKEQLALAQSREQAARLETKNILAITLKLKEAFEAEALAIPQDLMNQTNISSPMTATNINQLLYGDTAEETQPTYEQLHDRNTALRQQLAISDRRLKQLDQEVASLRTQLQTAQLTGVAGAASPRATMPPLLTPSDITARLHGTILFLESSYVQKEAEAEEYKEAAQRVKAMEAEKLQLTQQVTELSGLREKYQQLETSVQAVNESKQTLQNSCQRQNIVILELNKEIETLKNTISVLSQGQSQSQTQAQTTPRNLATLPSPSPSTAIPTSPLKTTTTTPTAATTTASSSNAASTSSSTAIASVSSPAKSSSTIPSATTTPKASSTSSFASPSSVRDSSVPSTTGSGDPTTTTVTSPFFSDEPFFSSEPGSSAPTITPTAAASASATTTAIAADGLAASDQTYATPSWSDPTGVWVKYTTDDGRDYYFNTTTQESRWEPPTLTATASADTTSSYDANAYYNYYNSTANATSDSTSATPSSSSSYPAPTQADSLARRPTVDYAADFDDEADTDLPDLNSARFNIEDIKPTTNVPNTQTTQTTKNTTQQDEDEIPEDVDFF